jgi:hypothetical protein
MATNNVSPKKGKVVDIPTAPTVGSATAGAESATVAYTAATVGGPATTFTALSSPGSITGTGTSPITVSGLTSGTAYTFTVRGTNSTGNGEYSAASNSITAATAGNDYELLTRTTLSAYTDTVLFSSIPQTYKHLQVRATMNGTGAWWFVTRINGNATAANYTSRGTYTDGSTGSSMNLGAGAGGSWPLVAPAALAGFS